MTITALMGTVMMGTAVTGIGVTGIGVTGMGVTGLGTIGAGPAAAARVCPAVTAQHLIPTPGATGWAENLLADTDGGLWVTRTFSNTVEHYDSHGARTASVHVDAPGAIRRGPDGLLYVATGDSTVNMVPGTALTGTIVTIDPDVRQPVPKVFATGLGMPNGLAVADDGAVYVADGRLGVLRISPNGRLDTAWSAAAPKNLAPTSTVDGTGVNGAVIVGDNLYVTLTFSATGRVLRVPLDDPARASAAADLTSPLPGILDDLAALDENTLAVASTTGQLHIVDLTTREVCTSTLGTPLTSVATIPGHPRNLLAGSETGQILRLRLG
ncbi:SMP-30/gluconolactonase/LRE family protein [Gordonia sp. NPDC003376]